MARYFPREISWRGKKGLDDLHDVRFVSTDTSGGEDIWQPVKLEASPWLWSSVTNPATPVQFAWSSENRSLMRATAGIERAEGLIPVEKLSKEDYQTIEKAFVTSCMDVKDTDRHPFGMVIDISSER